MRYVFLVYVDESLLESLSGAELDSLGQDAAGCEAVLRRSGLCLGGQRLQPAHTATTLRVRGPSRLLTDGPSETSRDRLGGYYLIDARDLNEAIRTAARFPGAAFGAIEVRPVRTSHPPEHTS